MYKNILIICALLAVTVFSGSASALTINDGSTSVGNVDDLYAFLTLPNSADRTEEDWVKDVLDLPSTTDFSFLKYDFSDTGDYTYSLWHQTDDETAWAFQLTGTPDYFLIKTGKGTTNYSHYLFKNNDSREWAVISHSENFDIKDIQDVSHLNEYTPVPEPSTVLLLGAGILGLLVHGRRRIKS